ncbi:MAG TPA: hypothetical protein ENJ20_07065 [Bacteroidetes bacterium]|nr:hypothetical protein [Bacteroidota bacterium]
MAKELNTDFGMLWPDYGARWYDIPLAQVRRNVSIPGYVSVRCQPAYGHSRSKKLHIPFGNMDFSNIFTALFQVAPKQYLFF